MINLVRRYYLRIYGYLTFGKKVYVYGNFRVGNRRNVIIGTNCAINSGVLITGRDKIIIGNNVVLSADCKLVDTGLDLNSFLDGNSPKHVSKPIIVEDGVWIGTGAIILQGVTLGRKCIVGAGSVVTKDVPPATVVAGNPARVIKQLREPTN